MILKAHLTSYSRVSGSRWLITLSWLSGSYWDIIVQLLCVLLPPLLNLVCFCQVLAISILYCAHLCMKYSLGISNFLEEISSLSYSIVFHFVFIVYLRFSYFSLLFFGTLHSVGCVFLFLLWLFLFLAVCKASSDNHFAFHISFSWGWFWSLPPVKW